MKIQKKYVVVLVSIIIVVGFLIYRNYEAEQKNNKIEKIQVARGDLAEEVTISGKIKAEEDIALHFQTSGKVSWIGVKEGDMVKKYQTIATLDTQEIKKNLDKKLNTFSFIIVIFIQRFFPAYINIQTIAIALGVSSFIGIIFGVFPAKQASELSPIDAIRYE